MLMITKKAHFSVFVDAVSVIQINIFLWSCCIFSLAFQTEKTTYLAVNKLEETKVP